MDVSTGIFRQYDIRGVVGKDLTPDLARLLGRAFSVLLRRSRPSARSASVGRDVRLSSPELSAALMEGIASTGLDVYDLGVCPTPLQYFSLHHLPVDGGIMITGSHNPPEYNGFKVSVGKETIFGEGIKELHRIMTGGDVPAARSSGAVRSYDIISAYERYVQENLAGTAPARKQRRALKVVVDAGNGTAGPIAPKLVRSMGCDVVELYCEPDGRFPNHHPDPTVVEYIQDLIRTVRKEKADLGVGYDGDADRIGLVDADGSIVWGDQLLAILARDILARHPGTPVIADVKCSQTLFDDIARHGGVPIMTRTGHSLVKDRMKREHALLAGEFSGHIFIGDNYFGYDDAIYTTLRVIDIMLRTGKPLRALLEGIPVMTGTPEIRFDCPDDRKEHVAARLQEILVRRRDAGTSSLPIRDIIMIDGVRVVFENGWGLLRSSNTQPVLVMRFEATTESKLASYRHFLEHEIQAILSEKGHP